MGAVFVQLLLVMNVLGSHDILDTSKQNSSRESRNILLPCIVWIQWNLSNPDTLGTEHLLSGCPWDRTSLIRTPLGRNISYLDTLGTEHLLSGHPWDRTSPIWMPLEQNLSYLEYLGQNISYLDTLGTEHLLSGCPWDKTSLIWTYLGQSLLTLDTLRTQ